jgi:hypothetical protein
VTGAKVAANTLDATDLAADSVAASELASDAVDTAAIQADAVTSAKIAAGAISKADISPSGMASTITINPPSIASNSCTIVNTTMTGILPGDVVIFNADVAEAGLIADPSEQDTADQLRIRFCNMTGAAIDGVSRTHNFVVIR